jgi:hypothetical protein
MDLINVFQKKLVKDMPKVWDVVLGRLDALWQETYSTSIICLVSF